LQLYALIHFYTNEPLQCYSRIDLFSNQRWYFLEYYLKNK
jgi:hypothetical protein